MRRNPEPPEPAPGVRLALFCLGVALAMAASGCGGPAADSQATAAVPAATEVPEVTELEVREPRASLMPGMGAVYLTVVNPGRASDRLLRVETGAARAAETHESVEEDGVVRMVARPDGFEVPAGGTLALEPGGKHIMLIEPRAPEPPAAAIRLTLHFERAGAIEVEAALAAMGGADHTGHGADETGHDAGHDGHDMDHGEHSEHGHDEGSSKP